MDYGNLPSDILVEIAKYVCSTTAPVSTMSQVCRAWADILKRDQSVVISSLLARFSTMVNALVWAYGREKCEIEVIRVMKIIIDFECIDLGDSESVHAIVAHAAHKGRTEICKLLLERGASASAHGSGSLICATIRGHLEICRLLLDHGAQLNAQGSDVLMYASHMGYIDIVRLLMDRGASASANDSQCVVVALERGCIDIVELLVAAGGKLPCN
jgi:hypothetical protein